MQTTKYTRTADVVMNAMKTATAARVARYLATDIRASGLPCDDLDAVSRIELDTLVSRLVRNAVARAQGVEIG